MPCEKRDETPVKAFTYRASDDSGRVISGTAEARSKDEIVRRLQERGYHVEVAEGGRLDPGDERSAGEEAVLRLAATVLDEAAKNEAQRIRVAVVGGDRVVASFLIGERWHEVLSVPYYVWMPLKACLARRAGTKLSYGVAREPGRLQHTCEGRECHFVVSIRRRTVLMERQ